MWRHAGDRRGHHVRHLRDAHGHWPPSVVPRHPEPRATGLLVAEPSISWKAPRWLAPVLFDDPATPDTEIRRRRLDKRGSIARRWSRFLVAASPITPCRSPKTRSSTDIAGGQVVDSLLSW